MPVSGYEDQQQMAHKVCPFWVGYVLVNPMRRLLHNPGRILGSHIKPGMTVLDMGCAMGFFSLPLAEMIGPTGKVVCADVQEKMLQALEKRAARAGLADRVVTRLCEGRAPDLGHLNGRVDFALAFAVAHEVPDRAAFFSEICRVMKSGTECLLAEPRKRVSPEQFEETVSAAGGAGLELVDRPRIALCHAALLRKRPAWEA